MVAGLTWAQQIRSVQLFNPNTNDETPIIGMSDRLILRFDDFANSSTIYNYTIKHYDRNWEDDGLFFTEYADGTLNAQINKFEYSFNTLQRYTHYELPFPNDKIRPKISGNFELIVYDDDVQNPVLKKRFIVTESNANIGVNVTRTSDAKRPDINQRVEVKVVGNGNTLSSNLNSISLNVIQNNNWQIGVFNQRPTATMGNQVMFQQLNLAFPGNNEFYYFDNKIITQAFNMVAGVKFDEVTYHTYLHPVLAYPMSYQYQPDVNGSYYFRRNDLGIERDADKEGDYSWVYFALDSDPMDKDVFVLGGFNDFKADDTSKMYYDEAKRQYIAKIYLKQGFYSYILATKENDGRLNYGEINGSFWQTENLYQALLYYKPFGRNYDGVMGYGEFRTPVR